MVDGYYSWLISLLGDGYLERNYQKLLHRLFEKEFYWSVDYDGNQADNGLHLRKLYSRETGCVCDVDRGCTVLEVLISLCRKCEDDLMYDPDDGDRTGYWFWIIMENLHLDVYDDGWYDPHAVDRILDIFLDRDYTRDGFGGPFPVYHHTQDLRDMDLWWQMNAWLVENYPLENS